MTADEGRTSSSDRTTSSSAQARADELVPNADEAIWHSNDACFRRGTGGDWRDVLGPDDLARYDERVAALVAPPVARWAHHGGSS